MKSFQPVATRRCPSPTTAAASNAHELGQVFEPFFTKKRAKETSGSGLGLAIVHGVVKEHEGFIDVASTPGVGTTITLYFPLVDGLERREPVLTAPRGDARILIVDDEPILLRTGRRVLGRLGYQVEVMESGLRAYELFSRCGCLGAQPVRPGDHGHVAGRGPRRSAGHRTDPASVPRAEGHRRRAVTRRPSAPSWRSGRASPGSASRTAWTPSPRPSSGS